MYAAMQSAYHGRVKARRKELQDIRARLLASQAQPVRLRMAASVVHHALTRQARASMRGADYLEALNKAATALAQVADIYCRAGPLGRLLRIPEEELAGGRFEDGGNLFHAATGTVYKALMVRRVDVLAGLEVLRRAQKALETAAAPGEGPSMESEKRRA